MNDSSIEKELRSLDGEKKVGAMAIASNQRKIAEDLNGTMGKDMLDILSGKKTIELKKKVVFKNKINKFIKWIIGE